MRSHAEPGNEKLFYAGFGLEMLGIIAQPAFILTYALQLIHLPGPAKNSLKQTLITCRCELCA